MLTALPGLRVDQPQVDSIKIACVEAQRTLMIYNNTTPIRVSQSLLLSRKLRFGPHFGTSSQVADVIVLFVNAAI
jgi:hypothetical protein